MSDRISDFLGAMELFGFGKAADIKKLETAKEELLTKYPVEMRERVVKAARSAARTALQQIPSQYRKAFKLYGAGDSYMLEECIEDFTTNNKVEKHKVDDKKLTIYGLRFPIVEFDLWPFAKALGIAARDFWDDAAAIKVYDECIVGINQVADTLSKQFNGANFLVDGSGDWDDFYFDLWLY